MDFFHSGNYDAESRLGSAAGMDLALATGRGEPLLTEWPGAGMALVADDDTMQVGDREAEDPDEESTGTLDASITQLTVQEILRRGVAEFVRWDRGVDRWTRTRPRVAPCGPRRAR